MLPSAHLSGQGCPKCKSSKLENMVINYLENNNFSYIYQCRHSTFSWLGLMNLNFYLPNYNIAIECQGEQHYRPIKWFGGQKTFDKQIERDKKKRILCEDNNIKLLYIDKDTNIEKLFKENKLWHAVAKHEENLKKTTENKFQETKLQ